MLSSRVHASADLFTNGPQFDRIKFRPRKASDWAGTKPYLTLRLVSDSWSVNMDLEEVQTATVEIKQKRAHYWTPLSAFSSLALEKDNISRPFDLWNPSTSY